MMVNDSPEFLEYTAGATETMRAILRKSPVKPWLNDPASLESGEPAQPAESPEAWKATYVRLIMNRNLDVTRKWAADEAEYSWDHWNRERGDNPMPSPAEAISEDKHEWMTR